MAPKSHRALIARRDLWLLIVGLKDDEEEGSQNVDKRRQKRGEDYRHKDIAKKFPTSVRAKKNQIKEIDHAPYLQGVTQKIDEKPEQQQKTDNQLAQSGKHGWVGNKAAAADSSPPHVGGFNGAGLCPRVSPKPISSNAALRPWGGSSRNAISDGKSRVCLRIHFGGFPFRRQTFFVLFEPPPFSQPRVLTKRRSKPGSQRQQTSNRFWRILLRCLALP